MIRNLWAYVFACTVSLCHAMSSTSSDLEAFAFIDTIFSDRSNESTSSLLVATPHLSTSSKRLHSSLFDSPMRRDDNKRQRGLQPLSEQHEEVLLQTKLELAALRRQVASQSTQLDKAVERIQELEQFAYPWQQLPPGTLRPALDKLWDRMNTSDEKLGQLQLELTQANEAQHAHQVALDTRISTLCKRIETVETTLQTIQTELTDLSENTDSFNLEELLKTFRTQSNDLLRLRNDLQLVLADQATSSQQATSMQQLLTRHTQDISELKAAVTARDNRLLQGLRHMQAGMSRLIGSWQEVNADEQRDELPTMELPSIDPSWWPTLEPSCSPPPSLNRTPASAPNSPSHASESSTANNCIQNNQLSILPPDQLLDDIPAAEIVDDSQTIIDAVSAITALGDSPISLASNASSAWESLLNLQAGFSCSTYNPCGQDKIMQEMAHKWMLRSYSTIKRASYEAALSSLTALFTQVPDKKSNLAARILITVAQHHISQYRTTRNSSYLTIAGQIYTHIKMQQLRLEEETYGTFTIKPATMSLVRLENSLSRFAPRNITPSTSA